MGKTYINAIATAVPDYCIAQSDAAQFMSKILGLSLVETRRLRLLYRQTAIDTRYSVIEDYQGITQDFFKQEKQAINFPSTAQRSAIYAKEALKLALKAAKSLENQVPVSNKNDDFYGEEEEQSSLSDVSHLITVSCTGMYAPGIDIELVQQLGLSSAVERTCINFMGCYAAFNALKMANHICQSQPEAKVLIVAVELCTLHLQPSKREDDLLANALFADGAAAVLLSQQRHTEGFSLEGFHCGLAPSGAEDMAWQIGDFGFEMRLSAYVPNILRQAIRPNLSQLLAAHQLELKDIELFALHPGGKRILQYIEETLQLQPEANQAAYETLKHYGNMSSVTILFVLKYLLEQSKPSNSPQNVLAMAFGPGLTIETGLLELHKL